MSSNSRHVAFFKACAQQAALSQMTFRLGAVVVKNNRIIGRGKNMSIRSTHEGPISPTSIPNLSLHAEASALRSCLHFNARTPLFAFPSYTLPVVSHSGQGDDSKGSVSSPCFSTAANLKHLPQVKHLHHHRKRCYTDALTKLSNTTVYVGRWNNLGECLSAKPCWRCIHLMLQYGVKRVFWTVPSTTQDASLLGTVSTSLHKVARSNSTSSPSSPSSSSPTRKLPAGNCQLHWQEGKVEDLWREIVEHENLITSGYLTIVEEQAWRKAVVADRSRTSPLDQSNLAASLLKLTVKPDEGHVLLWFTATVDRGTTDDEIKIAFQALLRHALEIVERTSWISKRQLSEGTRQYTKQSDHESSAYLVKKMKKESTNARYQA
ncbi:Cytidine deaminase-like [Phaffia rhodozyma]|uniref:Cytidine deaminase-like n=1 Tax=Phaffia rhodozyma TaxID=264483 RepID=A0A0F7SSD8_PHARH|nr:Cytidine deaminase-like [Phaffia rhodozyma]